MSKPFLKEPHRRWNPLKQEWILVSPHRTQRPWQGQREEIATSPSVSYDPNCYLCPGNTRAGTKKNPCYTGTFAFDNDYAALKPNQLDDSIDESGLLRAETENGTCRVLCFSPRHDLTLATMTVAEVRTVVDMWRAQTKELSSRPDTQYVQVFENRGSMMGASNPHPHGQIWATEHIPNEAAAELHAQQSYLADNGKSLLASYRDLELERRERIVVENETWLALVPFWAVWPFEVMMLPKANVSTLLELNEQSQEDLASMLQQVTRGYNRVFDTPFPYSMGLHPAPCDGDDHPEWLLHLHFYPPLLRSATVRKFMVGFELLGSAQRDLTPEEAAATLSKALNMAV